MAFALPRSALRLAGEFHRGRTREGRDRLPTGTSRVHLHAYVRSERSESGHSRTGPVPRAQSSTWPLLLRTKERSDTAEVRSIVVLVRHKSRCSSLVNMYKELKADIDGFVIPSHGTLSGWAKQGVLLLNACLTVEKGKANSHKGKGWEKLTDAIVQYLNDRSANIVFLLWGRDAQNKGARINKARHHVLTAAHPSPLSAHNGFMGCKVGTTPHPHSPLVSLCLQHFSKTNAYLESAGLPKIDWSYLPSEDDLALD